MDPNVVTECNKVSLGYNNCICTTKIIIVGKSLCTSALSLLSIGIGLSISAAVTGFFLLIFLLKAKNSHLIRDESGYPSLAKFQLLSWTMIIAFSYFGIYLARIIDGVAFPPPDFPAELVALMGISVVSTAVNKKLSDDKYETANAKFNPDGKGYVTMVKENGKLELTRLQISLDYN
jgi:hypothetical protein